jgi:dipeptidyl-peptidase-4
MAAVRNRSNRSAWLAGLLCFAILALGISARVQSAPAAQATGAARALTVERIYSYPSLNGRVLHDTVWSPDGKLLTYLSDETDTGGPQIWAVDAATGQRHVLVDNQHLRSILLPPASRGQTTGLGRLTPAQYLWSPDGKALLFISAQELFWYDLAPQTSRRLVTAAQSTQGTDEAAETVGAIDDAKISPDGRWASFLRAHDVWVVSVAGGQPRQITRGGNEGRRNGELDWVYPEELDISTAYWWSPDSAKIAFLQLDESHVEKYPLVDELSPKGNAVEERYPVAGSPNPIARVGVVSPTGGEVRWMDTGNDSSALLARVAWLHDSRRVAIEHLNRPQDRLDLLFADAASGKSQSVLTEQDKYWINLSDDLHFLADNQRFLWSSERDGFRHLYLYDLAGKQLAQLTRGAWQIEGVAGVDEQNGQVYFTSTQQSPIERQFYRVAFSGGAPVQLTHERGTHRVSLAPGAAHFLDTYSNAMNPPRQNLFSADGSAVAALAENRVAELADYRLQPVEFLTVPGADGTALDASLIKPPGFDPARKYPVIVYVYGGPQAQEVRDAWQGADFLWHQLMAQKGFVIFSVDNRGMSGRGHNFETPIYHHFGQAELADQLAGVAWLTKQTYVDRARISIWGWSYGGYMTCMAMLRGGGIFKAGFAGAPVTDWRQYDTIYTERYMGTPQENPEGYRDSSPVNFASRLEGQLLIAHATGDDNVHFANTVEFAESLVNAQKYAEYQIYAGRGHGISDAPARIHVFNRVTQFFLENLAQ